MVIGWVEKKATSNRLEKAMIRQMCSLFGYDLQKIGRVVKKQSGGYEGDRI
jgi:hypothetical protein